MSLKTTGLALYECTFEYEICILTPKSSKQNILFIGYCVLIGWFFFSMSTQIVLKGFMTVRPGA
jgi:hypothetical protein